MFIQHRYSIVFMVMSMGIAFLCLITIGCATKKMSSIDPPSLQMDPSDGPSWKPKNETVTDSKNKNDKWEVKRSSSYKCEDIDPVTGEQYPTTIDENDKVEFSEELKEEIAKARWIYWKTHSEEFQEWLDKHPKQKKKHEKWLEEQRVKRALLIESANSSSGGGSDSSGDSGGGGH